MLARRNKNKMRILISGSSGMVGTAVTHLLAENGYTVSRLLRRQSKGKITEAVPPVKEPPSDTSPIDPQEIDEPSVDAPAEGRVEEPVNADIEVPTREIPNDVRWDPIANEFDAQTAEGADAVVHLAGASIGGGRWTNARKASLRSSRVEATRHLVTSLSALSAKPKVFVGVSAV